MKVMTALAVLLGVIVLAPSDPTKSLVLVTGTNLLEATAPVTGGQCIAEGTVTLRFPYVTPPFTFASASGRQIVSIPPAEAGPVVVEKLSGSAKVTCWWTPGTLPVVTPTPTPTPTVTPTPTPAPIGVQSVSLSAGSVVVGGTVQATAMSTTGTVISVAWSSSAPSVATIDAAGLITAVAPGTANITATVSSTTASATLTVTAPPPPTGLVQPTDVTYLCTFRPPANDFAYGGRGLSYNPAHDSLYVFGHAYYSKLAELSIPACNGATTVATTPRATYLQPLTDVFRTAATPAGDLNPLNSLFGGHTTYPGQVYVGANDLIVPAWVYYDTSVQQKSHFRLPKTLTAGSAVGPSQIVSGQAGFVDGWMVPFPPDWQAALGGDLCAGQGDIPIITRTSFGFACTVFTAADIGNPLPIPATPIVEFPIDGTVKDSQGKVIHTETLGGWNTSGTLYNGTSLIAGGVAIPNSRTLISIHRRGMGPFCYGVGVSNPALNGTTNAAGEMQCYDPTESSKGNHAYPYELWLTLWDRDDFVAVKNGLKQRYNVAPYAQAKLALPFTGPKVGGETLQMTFDSATRRLFLIEGYVSGGTPPAEPIIHVLTVK